MIKPGDVTSYLQMCQQEGLSLRRGINFRINGPISVILMSLRLGAPYADRIEEGGGSSSTKATMPFGRREAPTPRLFSPYWRWGGCGAQRSWLSSWQRGRLRLWGRGTIWELGRSRSLSR